MRVWPMISEKNSKKPLSGIPSFSVTEYNKRISTPLPGQFQCSCDGQDCPLCGTTQLPPTRTNTSTLDTELPSTLDTDLISETPCRKDHDKLGPRFDQISRTFASELKNLTYDNGQTGRPVDGSLRAPQIMTNERETGQLFRIQSPQERTPTRISSNDEGKQERKKGETPTALAPGVPLIDLTGDSLVTQDGSFLKKKYDSPAASEGELSGLSCSLREALYQFQTYMCPNSLERGNGPRLRPRPGHWRSFSSATASPGNEEGAKTDEDTREKLLKVDGEQPKKEQPSKKGQASGPSTQKIIWTRAEQRPKVMGRGSGKSRINAGEDVKTKTKPLPAQTKQWRGQSTVLHSGRGNRTRAGQGVVGGEDGIDNMPKNPRKTPERGATQRFLTSTQRRSLTAVTTSDPPGVFEFEKSITEGLVLPKPVPATDTARKRKALTRGSQTSPKRHAVDVNNAIARGDTTLLTASTLPIVSRQQSLMDNSSYFIPRRNRQLNILPHPEVQDATTMCDTTLNRRLVNETIIRGNRHRENAIEEEEVVILASNTELLARITKLEKYASLLETQVRKLTRRDALAEERLCHAEHVLPRIRRLEKRSALTGSEIRPPLCRACFGDIPPPEPYFECRRHPRHPDFNQRYDLIKPEPRAEIDYPQLPRLGPV